MRSTWKPLLTGATATEADRSILEIADALGSPEWSPERISGGVAAGSAGLAIFYHEVAERWPEQRYRDLRDIHWNGAIDDLASAPSVAPNLFSGFTGIGWATILLNADRSEKTEDDIHQDLDDELLDCLRSLPNPATYDLINGPVGWGLYALERWPHPRAVQALELIVDFLYESAERTPDGISWHTPPGFLPEHQRQHSPDGYYNLGLSHGVPGICVLMAQTWVRGVRTDRSLELLEGSVSWCLAQEITDSGGLSFPFSVVPGAPRVPSRLAWCYGDLGIAAALLTAGSVTERTAWVDKAIRIARRAAVVSQEQSGVKDAALCHGAGGNGHVFNRLYQATGEQVLADAARSWFQKTLAMRQEGIGPGGYAAWRLEPREGWHATPGLLEGSAGIGLALLAATGDREPRWDRLLSISSVPHLVLTAP